MRYIKRSERGLFDVIPELDPILYGPEWNSEPKNYVKNFDNPK